MILLGELAEVSVTMKWLGVPSGKQWAALLWFLSCISLAAIAPKLVLGGPECGHPCPALARRSVVRLPLARGHLPLHEQLQHSAALPEAPCQGVSAISNQETGCLFQV